MSVKKPKLERRPRAWLVEECRTCGMKAGMKCTDYKGRNCAPHALALPPIAKAEAATPQPLTQGDLFAPIGDGSAGEGVGDG